MSIFRPPKINLPKPGSFWRQLAKIVLGTTISLLFTIIAAQLLERRQRAKDRELSALMVMGNIEDFANAIDGIVADHQRMDSISTWLLGVSVEDLEQLPEENINDLVVEALTYRLIRFDRAAENIFSNNIETWKNMCNFQFINNVGNCFSRMHNVEDLWNSRILEEEKYTNEISQNPDSYPGKYVCTKWLRDPRVRSIMEKNHNYTCWMSYQADYLRHLNKMNMEVIGIKEEKLKAFMNDFHKEILIEEKAPNEDDYYTPKLKSKDLGTLAPYQKQLDSIYLSL